MNTKSNVILFAAIVLILDPCLGWAIEVDPSLRSLIQVALDRSLSVRSLSLRVEQVEMAKKDSYAALLPALSLSAGQSWTKSESESSAEVTESQTTSNSLKVTGGWTLWDHGATLRQIQTANLNSEISKLSAEKERDSFVYSVLDQYLDYLLQVRQENLATRYLEQSKKTDEEARTMVQAGAKTPVEALDTEISVMDAERSVLEARATMKTAERSLRAMLNLPSDEKIPVLNLIDIKPYFLDTFQRVVEEIRRLSPGDRIEKSREGAIAKYDLDKSLIEYRSAQWDYWPQLKIGASHEWDFDQKVNEQTDETTPVLQSTSVYATLSWSLFDWFTSTRSLKSSEYEFQIKNNSYFDSKRLALAESDNQLEQYDILVKSVDSSRLSLEKSKKQLEVSREMHRLGRINLLMMQQSTSRYFEAESAYASRLKNLYLIMANILIKNGISILPSR